MSNRTVYVTAAQIVDGATNIEVAMAKILDANMPGWNEWPLTTTERKAHCILLVREQLKAMAEFSYEETSSQLDLIRRF